MKQFDLKALTRFQESFDTTGDVLDVVADTIGDTCTASGLWRIFGRSMPKLGIHDWNSQSLWKQHWGDLAHDITCIGEDIFGNQLVCITETSNLLIWDHENGGLFTLNLNPQDAFEVVLKHGIGWIDFYNDKYIQVGLDRLVDLTENSHVHWTTPLILGGEIDINNTSIIDRVNHLIGHGKLWCQLQDVSLGSSVIIKPS